MPQAKTYICDDKVLIIFHPIAGSDNPLVPIENFVVALANQRDRLERCRYLPMDCPVCGRARLYYDPLNEDITCDKCGGEWAMDENNKVKNRPSTHHL